MMKELKSTVNQPDQKILTTDNKPITKTASVIKIDNPTTPINNKSVDDKITIKKIDETPLSFNNLYPNIAGKGKVDDITPPSIIKLDEVPPNTEVKQDKLNPIDKVKDINASVMKEVISLDKKEEQIDETQTLDNFFKDVQQLANPMEPIKEETKYTLFEDAPLSE